MLNYLRIMLSDFHELIPLGLLVLLASVVCEWTARKEWLPYWLSRKVLHVIAVGACAWAPLWVESLWSLIAIVGPAWLVLLWLVSTRKLMVDEEGRRAWGIVWFPLSYLILLALSGDNKSPVVFGMAILAVCDPAATVAGTLFAKKYFTLTGDRKSWIGSGAFFLSFLILSGLLFASLDVGKIEWLILLPIFGIMLSAVEALGSGGKDNLYIPLVTAALWQRTENGSPAFEIDSIYGVALLSIIFVWYVQKRGKLTADGAVGAAILAVGIVWFGHWILLTPILLFFVSSIAVEKLFPSNLPSDVKTGRGRDLIQVYANGGIYLLVIFFLFPSAPGAFITVDVGKAIIHTPLFSYFVIPEMQLGGFWLDICTSAGGYLWATDWWTSALQEQDIRSLAPYFSGMLFIPLAVLATANCDTWASEIGRYFKGRTYDITRFKRVEPGLSGGISFAGTLGGGFGAAAIAALAFVISSDWISGVIVYAFIWFFGFLGMLVDSILGALFQRKYEHPKTGKLYDHPWWEEEHREHEEHEEHEEHGEHIEQKGPGGDFPRSREVYSAQHQGLPTEIRASIPIQKEEELIYKSILRKLQMSNDAVNFISQLIIAALMIWLFG
ncbi:MAG: DUF92 domain-containing protein [Bacteroidota bacterium]